MADKQPNSDTGTMHTGGMARPDLSGTVTHCQPSGSAANNLAPMHGPDELGWLGSCRVLRVLGQGGMETVFLAEDIRLARQVPFKVMRPDAASANARARFLREARHAGQNRP